MSSDIDGGAIYKDVRGQGCLWFCWLFIVLPSGIWGLF